MKNNELHFVMYKLKAQELIKFNVHMLRIVRCIVNNSHSTSQFPRTCILSSNPLLEVLEPQYPHTTEFSTLIVPVHFFKLVERIY